MIHVPPRVKSVALIPYKIAINVDRITPASLKHAKSAKNRMLGGLAVLA